MHLATKPKYMHALRKELREHASSYHCQRSLSLLDAIINESMRVSPSVFFATQRVTPPEGIKIKEHFIPGNMIVQIPHFALYHDPRNFVRPDEFLPERWLDQPELVLRKDAFFPFLVGPYSCAGKALAMMELRSVISRVISEFDVKVPEGFDGQRYFDGIKDHVTAEGPEADVTFVKAEG
jgi:cytochrome P450